MDAALYMIALYDAGRSCRDAVDDCKTWWGEVSTKEIAP